MFETQQICSYFLLICLYQYFQLLKCCRVVFSKLRLAFQDQKEYQIFFAQKFMRQVVQQKFVKKYINKILIRKYITRLIDYLQKYFKLGLKRFQIFKFFDNFIKSCNQDELVRKEYNTTFLQNLLDILYYVNKKSLLAYYQVQLQSISYHKEVDTLKKANKWNSFTKRAQQYDSKFKKTQNIHKVIKKNQKGLRISQHSLSKGMLQIQYISKNIYIKKEYNVQTAQNLNRIKHTTEIVDRHKRCKEQNKKTNKKGLNFNSMNRYQLGIFNDFRKKNFCLLNKRTSFFTINML